jgi:hypothetical protein
MIITKCGDYVDKFCLESNKIAMDFLATNDFEMCFKLLKNSEKILLNNAPETERILGAEIAEMAPEHRRRLLSLTFNNLGCYYKK